MNKTDTAKIEITDEMLEAGTFALLDYDSIEDNAFDAARDIYLAMEKARSSSSKDTQGKTEVRS